MRNLKKTLSLCLAFVMLFGLMVVGAGAVEFNEYTDLDTIAENRKEAVDLLNALKIMEGTENGSFGPTATLERDQAAKIVAWANLGKDAKGNVTVSGDPFSDVAKDNWAAPYVTYCKNTKIINGIGDGSYAPHEAVSGFQLGKMLLCVVGYGVNGEYTGGNWNMKVASDGIVTGLFNGIENVGNDPISRQDAAQMVFNALTLEMVAYSELYGTYSSEFHNALNPTLLGTKAEQVFNVRSYDKTNIDGTDYHTWRYINTSTDITNAYDCDEEKSEWIYSATGNQLLKDRDFCDYVEIWENGNQITADVYYLGDIKMEKVANLPVYRSSALKSTQKAITYQGQRIKLYDEGAKCKYDTVYETSNTGTWGWLGSGWLSSSSATIKSNHTIPGGSAGTIDKIIVSTSYLAKVTSASANSFTATIYAPTSDKKTFSETFEVANSFTKDQYILVEPNVTLDTVITHSAKVLQDEHVDDVISCDEAQKISAATVTAYSFNSNNKANGAVTTGGQSRNYNGVFANYTHDTTNKEKIVTDSANNKDETRVALGERYTRKTGQEYYVGKGTYTFYLDYNNNVIGVDENSAGIRDFAYIIEVGHDDFYYYNTVKVVLSDGTVGNYYIDPSSDGYDGNGMRPSAGSTNDTKWDSIGNTTSEYYVRPGDMYAYSLNGNRIVLTDLDSSGTSYNVDNPTYDAVEDIYDVSKQESGGESRTQRRTILVEANTKNQNAFTRGGSTFSYTIKSNRAAECNQDHDGSRADTRKVLTGGTEKRAIWGAGQHVAYVTDNTVFTYVYGGNNDSLTVARYVGKNNAPTVEAGKDYSVSLVLRKTGNTYYVEYAVLRGSQPTNAMWSGNYFMVTGGYSRIGQDVDGKAIYYYPVIKDGQTTTIAVYSSGLTKGNVCTYDVNNSKFLGDPANDCEAGAYTATLAAEKNGVLYNVFADVDATSKVIVSRDRNNQQSQDTTLNNMSVNFAGARVWDMSGSTPKLLSDDDPDYLRTTDRVNIVVNTYTSAGYYYTATEVFIIQRYTAKAYTTAAETITSNTYIDSIGIDNRGLSNYTVQSGELYFDGNAANNGAVTGGTLTISGNLDTFTANNLTGGKLTVNGSLTAAGQTIGSGVTVEAGILNGNTGTLRVNGTLSVNGNNTVDGKLNYISTIEVDTNGRVIINDKDKILSGNKIVPKDNPNSTMYCTIKGATGATGATLVLNDVTYKWSDSGKAWYAENAGTVTSEAFNSQTSTVITPTTVTDDATLTNNKTLQANVTFDKDLTVQTGTTLTVAKDQVLTVNGDLNVENGANIVLSDGAKLVVKGTANGAGLSSIAQTAGTNAQITTGNVTGSALSVTKPITVTVGAVANGITSVGTGATVNATSVTGGIAGNQGTVTVTGAVTGAVSNNGTLTANTIAGDVTNSGTGTVTVNGTNGITGAVSNNGTGTVTTTKITKATGTANAITANAGTITVSNGVDGDIATNTGTITITGGMNGNIAANTGTITIDGTVARAAGDVLTGNIASCAGSITVNGNMTGNIGTADSAITGNVKVTGNVAGAVTVGTPAAAGNKVEVTGTITTVAANAGTITAGAITTVTANAGTITTAGAITTVTANDSTINSGTIGTVTANGGTITTTGAITTVTANASGKTITAGGQIGTITNNEGTINANGGIGEIVANESTINAKGTIGKVKDDVNGTLNIVEDVTITEVTTDSTGAGGVAAGSGTVAIATGKTLTIGTAKEAFLNKIAPATGATNCKVVLSAATPVNAATNFYDNQGTAISTNNVPAGTYSWVASLNSNAGGWQVPTTQAGS